MGWTLLAGIVAPAAFWIGYFRWKDRLRPEPDAALVATWVLGIVGGVAALRGYQLLEIAGLATDPEALAAGNPRAFAAYALLVIGPLEEAAKLLPFVLVSVRRKEVDEPVDGVVYAACIALGFASYENLFYLETLPPLTALARAVVSPLVHTLFATYWGVSAVRARMAGTGILAAVIPAFALAAVLHGTYDVLTVQPATRPLAALLVLALWICQMVRIRRMHAAALLRQPRPGVQ